MADILIIANPASGKFKIIKPLLHTIIDILKEKADKVELVLTEYRGHGTYLAQNFYISNYMSIKSKPCHKQKDFIINITNWYFFYIVFFWFGFNGIHINSENIKLNGVSFCQLDGEYTELQNKSTYIMIKENAINFTA